MGKPLDGKNSALFCCMCGISTEQGHEIGRIFFRSVSIEKKPCSAICGECISAAFNVINGKDEIKDESPIEDKSFKIKIKKQIEKVENPNKRIQLTPSSIFARLSSSIVGQEKAKKAIATALSWHMQKMIDPTIQKTNVLILGPTGTGKTEIARTAAKILDIPFVIADATTFTAHGYVGEDVESCLTRLLHAADYNIEKAQTGIIFIDEIDKLAEKSDNSFVGTTAVQQSLLKILEGTLVNIPKKVKTRTDPGEYVQIDTSRILFICAGAFSDLLEIKNKQSNQIGLLHKKEEKTDLFESISQKDFINFGLIPEFLGRFQVITNTTTLSEADLVRILKESDQSPLIQYKKMFSSYKIELIFSDEFLSKVAAEALSSGIGARGLKRVLEKRLGDLLFSIPDSPPEEKQIVL